MSLPVVEEDGFEAGEVFTGPEDCQILLTYDQIQFVLIMIKPESLRDDEIVEGFFLKIEEAEKDPDEIAFHRCLEDIREFAISACKGTMYEIAASVQKSSSTRQSLEDFLHPITFYLRLYTLEGHLQAKMLDDTEEYARMHEPVGLPMECAPPSVQTLIPALDLEFIKDIFMKKVLKVSKNGETYVFKSATNRNEGQLIREIRILHQISEIWAPETPNRPRVPRLLGLVTSRNQIMGILEEFVDGKNLHELEMTGISIAQRRNWWMQIKQTIALLHQNNLVWGDVKPDNILIDQAANAWLVDFGGSFTDGWVDEELMETVEGDLQGLQRIVEFLGLRG